MNIIFLSVAKMAKGKGNVQWHGEQRGKKRRENGRNFPAFFCSFPGSRFSPLSERLRQAKRYAKDMQNRYKQRKTAVNTIHVIQQNMQRLQLNPSDWLCYSWRDSEIQEPVQC